MLTVDSALRAPSALLHLPNGETTRQEIPLHRSYTGPTPIEWRAISRVKKGHVTRGGAEGGGWGRRLGGV